MALKAAVVTSLHHLSMNTLASAKNVTFPQNIDTKPSLRGSKGAEHSKEDLFFFVGGVRSCGPFINFGSLSEKLNSKWYHIFAFHEYFHSAKMHEFV